MTKGSIVNLKNNYGMIATDAYKFENEWIPFKIDNSMLVEKDGKQYIKYTEEVEFTLSQSQGIRNRDIKEATSVRFIGNEWKYQERIIEKNMVQKIRNRLSEYNFSYPELDDEEFVNWLKDNNVQLRMLEYLTPGIFTPKELLKLEYKEKIDFDDSDAQFKIGLLFGIDRVDIEFRKKLLSWIISIENAYKAYFTIISVAKDGQDIGADVISQWCSKKPKISKLVKRARNKQLYRVTSDEFDYLTSDNAVPLFDFMEQLELNELSELITNFYDIYVSKGEVPEILGKMKECIGFISDLCTLRNAAAHGRSILPMFMDPDYNGKWDLEFDNIENRANVEKWILFDLLKTKWEKLGYGEHSKQILNTIYGNPVRKAWVELNYIYFYIVQAIEPKNFELFFEEIRWFLSVEDDIYKQIKHVNLLNVRLSDMMRNTTSGISPSPYSEIANEAFSVWELFVR